MSTLDKYILRQKIRATQYVFAFLEGWQRLSPKCFVTHLAKGKVSVCPHLDPSSVNFSYFNIFL
jgi:hypothetical protein